MIILFNEFEVAIGIGTTIAFNVSTYSVQVSLKF